MEDCGDSPKHKNNSGHVHFADGIEPHNLIQVKEEGNSKVHVHLGFLQTNHKYEIQFEIPNLLGSEVAKGQKMPSNPNLAIVEVKPTDSTNTNLHILIHLLLVKEELLKDCFILEDKDKKKLDVILHARVLGKHTGTPMVKDGIHCLSVVKDNESENELT